MQDHDEVEESPAPQMQKRFAGGPRQVSVQLKASEPSLRRGVVPLGKKAPDSAITAPPEHETTNGNARVVEPAYAAFEESSVGPVIEQVAQNGETARAGESPTFTSPAAVEPLVEESAATTQTMGREAFAAVEEEPLAMTEPEPVTNIETVTQLEPVFEPESGIEERVSDTTIPEPIAPPEIAEEISTPEQSTDTTPWPEPVEQGQPVPYQTIVTAEDSAEIAASKELETSPSAGAEIAGVGRAIAGIGALRSTTPPELSLGREPHFASQPTTIETMPETLQTPTAPVIRTSGAPIQPTHPAHNAPAPQAAAGGMHTAVQITLSCEIASMQLTPTFKMGALQLRPISKVVTMRLASSSQQQAGMNLQVNFEISKVQPSAGSLGQMRLSPSQQQKPATNTTGSFNISGLQLVSGFEAAPLQLTPSQQGQASVLLTGAFQIATVEFSPTFDIAAMILNSTAKTVAVQLPSAGAAPIENAPMFEITNVQLAANGDIAMLQLNPVGAKRA